jgi:hypothetical protein
MLTLCMWRTSNYPRVGSRLRPVAQTLMRSMFNAPRQPSLCNASRQHRRWCRDKGIRNAVLDASRLAITQCREQFRYDPWNCSDKYRSISFSDGSKGTDTVNSMSFKNECASSSVADVDSFVTIRQLLNPIFNSLLVLICRWEIHTYLHRACTSNNTPWFLEILRNFLS